MQHQQTLKSAQPILPPAAELFPWRLLSERHPHILNLNRVQWAVRHRETNGLKDAVFNSRSGELVVHEPAFLSWYLGLTGRAKPRTPRRRKRKAPV